MKTFHLKILTPFKKYLEQDIEFLHVQNDESVLGIFANHAPLVSSLKISKMYFEANGVRNNYAISGGVLSIKNNSVTIFVEAIEKSDEIDLTRAMASRDRALARLDKGDEIDVSRAKASLERALNRITIAGLK